MIPETVDCIRALTRLEPDGAIHREDGTRPPRDYPRLPVSDEVDLATLECRMRPIALILVPLDGSPFSEQALPFALDIAGAHGATVELVHIQVPAPRAYNAPAYDTSFDRDQRAERGRWLAALGERLAGERNQPVNSVFLDGEVGATLATHIASRRPDLLVMATHGRGGLSRAWLGSVADWLVRHLTVPLFLVRPAHEAGALQHWTPHRVLIPLDGSELAEAVLEPATVLGTPGETEYLLMTAVPPVGLTSGDAVIARQASKRSDDQPAEADRAAAANYLGRVAEDLRGRGFAVRIHVAIHAHPGHAILDYANEIGPDLIALATRGQSGLARLLLGSVADKVVRGAAVPVLVIAPLQSPPEPGPTG